MQGLNICPPAALLCCAALLLVAPAAPLGADCTACAPCQQLLQRCRLSTKHASAHPCGHALHEGAIHRAEGWHATMRNVTLREGPHSDTNTKCQRSPV